MLPGSSSVFGSTWSRLHLVRAQDGGAVRWPTRVALAHDGERLAARFVCRDDRRWATYATRDAPLWQEEVVELFLAPGPEVPARYVELEVNPLGALFDAVVENPDGRRDTMTVDTGWDGAGIRCRAASLGSDADWSAELIVPWRDVADGLGVGSSTMPAVWRANLLRVERPAGPDAAERDVEFSAWSPTGRDPADFHVPGRFGWMVLDGVEPRPAAAMLDRARRRGLPVVRVPRVGRLEANENGPAS